MREDPGPAVALSTLRPGAACLGFLACLSPSSLHADPDAIELSDQLGGSSFAIAVSDATAYLGVGPRIYVLDATDASAPSIVAQSEPLAGHVTHIEVSGERAYVLSDQAEAVAVIDGVDEIVPGQSTLSVIDVDERSLVSMPAAGRQLPF